MRQDSIDLFIENLSSVAPVPGGGGAAALMGGVASALCSMVANLTTGKKKYIDYEEDIQDVLKKTKILNDEILELIEEDAKAFEPLSKAYSIPKDDPTREEVLERALRVAADAPGKIIDKMIEVAKLIVLLSVEGSRLAISDVGVSACACMAAAKSAAMNVYINTKLMKDKEYAENLNHRTEEKVHDVCKTCEIAYDLVLAGLK